MKIKFKDSAFIRLKGFIQDSLKRNNKSGNDIDYISLTEKEILELGDNIISLEDGTPVVRIHTAEDYMLLRVLLSRDEV